MMQGASVVTIKNEHRIGRSNSKVSLLKLQNASSSKKCGPLHLRRAATSAATLSAGGA